MRKGWIAWLLTFCMVVGMFAAAPAAVFAEDMPLTGEGLPPEGGQAQTIYNVSVDTDLVGGSITAEPAAASSGTTIQLTIVPNSGKQLKPGTLVYNSGSGAHDIEGTSFAMPEADVTVAAVFEDIPVPVSVIEVSGNISSDTTWTADNVYVVKGDLYVAENGVLTIEPGTVIKVKSGVRVLIDGTLDARGTANQKIYFTDFRDDTAGGDTNGDGDATAPAAAGWPSILVGYSVNGEALLDHCILKYAGGNWGGWSTYNAPIIVNLGANVEISNSELSHSRLYGIRIENATGRISLTDNVIKNNGGHGIFSKNGSPSINGNSITDNGWYGLYVEGAALPGRISGNNFSDNSSGSINLAAKASGTSIEADNTGVEGIWVGGAISDDTTWGSDFPYVINGDLHVTKDKTLTIKPGMVVKVKSGFRILIDGTLDARGTADKKIYFTDFRDDTAGGDTNGDGNATAPAAAGWSSIIVGYSADGEALIDHCILKYAGGNWGGWNTYNAPIIINIGANAEISNSELSYSRLYGVRMENATGDISLANNEIKNNGGHGIYSKNSSPVISGNRLEANGGYGLYVEGTALPGSISGNTFGSNTSGIIGLGASAAGTTIGSDNTGVGGIWLLGGAISVDTVLGSAFPYIINTDVVVNEGSSLTILPGAILKFNGAKYLRILGTLETKGNADQLIYFTSYHDDDQNAGGDTNGNGSATLPDNNKWCGIRFEGAGAGNLAYGILRYAGESWGYGYDASHNSAVTILSSGNVALQDCDIGYSRVQGVRIDSASGTVSLENTGIHHNSQYGIHMNNSTATITVDDCMLFENAEGQVSLSNTPNLTIRNTTAAALSASAAPGAADGSTRVSAAAGSGNHLAVKVSSSAPGEPVLLSPEPSGDGVVNPYTAGADILGVDASTNKYLEVYEANADGKIVRFKVIVLSADDIYTIAAPPSLEASNVSIKGSAVEGEVLTGSYDFHGAEAEESGTTFRWLRISADETTVFTNDNIGGVGNGPSADTVFTIEKDMLISSIQNYHWNHGQGSSPVGEISLRDLEGRVFGPWQAQGLVGYMGVPNAYWLVLPHIILPAGTYTVIDSDPATWSQNGESGYQGFSHVKTVASEEIVGASGQNYQITASDVGYRLQFEVTVRDEDGTAGKPAVSGAIGPVIEKPEGNKAPQIAADWNYTTVYFGLNYPFSITVTDEENTPDAKIYSSLDNGPYSMVWTYPSAPGTQDFSLSPLKGVLAEGEHNLRYYAVDSEGAVSQVLTLTFLVAEVPDTPDPPDPPEPPDTDGNNGGGSAGRTEPTYKADVLEGRQQTATLPVVVDLNMKNGLVQLDAKKAEAFMKEKSVSTIAMPEVSGVSSFTLALPARSVAQNKGEGKLTVTTNYGNLIIPGNMLSHISDLQEKQAGITIGAGSKDGLSDGEKEAIGGRPLIQLTLSLDGKKTAWSNNDAPIRVSIPYEPTEEERKHPEKIVVWYLDGSGTLICIPNGIYDPAVGMVSFIVTHFSQFAVGYRDIGFSDVDERVWYHDAVSFLSSREITRGNGNGLFLPQSSLTRSEFIVMLMRTYEIAADSDPQDNFSDAGSRYYTGYLAAAKRLEITKGIGDNLFGPERKISRQEMVTLLYNVLEKMGRLPAADNGKSLAAFQDHEQIASWARTSMEMLVKAGVLNGKDDRLHPASITTRAEMAQILYMLMTGEKQEK